MAIMQCTCGQSLSVPDSLAGRVGKCPKCGQKVRIPASKPVHAPGEVPVVVATHRDGDDADDAGAGSGARARRAWRKMRPPSNAQWRRNIVPIAAGVLILATIIMPWEVGRGTGDKAVMSWKVISTLTANDCSFLIGTWVIGAAAVAVSLCVRDLALRAAHVGMGLLGIVLFWVALGGGATEPFKLVLEALPGKSAGVMQWWFWLLLVTCLAIALNVRLRMGGRLAVRLTVGVLAGGLAVWTVVRFFTTISAFTNSTDKDEMVLYLITALVAMVAMITICIIALVDVASIKDDKRKLSRGAVLSLYGTMAFLFAVLSVAWPLHMQPQPGMFMLKMVNTVVLVAGLLTIFASGVIELTGLLTEWFARRRLVASAPAGENVPADAPSATAPAPAAPNAEVLDARIRKLQTLLDNETISQEEYDTERRRILADI